MLNPFATTLPRGKTSLGVGVVKVNLEGLQPHPSSAVGDVMIVDGNGVIVLASRPAQQYRTMTKLTPEMTQSTLRDARQYENVELAPIGIKTEEAFEGEGAIVSLPGEKPGEERPRFLVREKKLDGSDWRIVILSDLSDIKLYQHWAFRSPHGGIVVDGVSVDLGKIHRIASPRSQSRVRDVGDINLDRVAMFVLSDGETYTSVTNVLRAWAQRWTAAFRRFSLYCLP